MILLNFSHPLTDAQRGQIEMLTGQTIDQIIALSPQFDEQQPFVPQVTHLVSQVPLASVQLQGAPILVMLPSLNFIAAGLLAELHGRMGYFPPVIRTRPIAGTVPRQYEVAEILDLQAIREGGRRSR